MRGSAAGERDQPAVLRLVAHLAPAPVIPVLLALARITAGRLEVAIVGAAIHTSRHAGGMARARMRPSVRRSRTGPPSAWL
jgi:hypothetical protein